MILVQAVVFGWALGTGAVGWAEEGILVVMPVRVNLVTWTLDTIRKDLEQRLGRSVSLSVRTMTAFSPEEASHGPSWLLLDAGGLPPPRHRFTGIRLSLYWVLAVRPELLAPVASDCPALRDEFVRVLQDLRAKPGVVFPWFEALYSPMTLRCFELAWPDSGGRGEFPSLRILQDALDRKSLNPFSIDSDEGMAFEVFEAGDAVFSTMWVNGEVLPPGSLLRGSLEEALFTPLPGPDGPTPVPQLDLLLWAPAEIPVASLPPAFAEPTTPEFAVRRLEVGMDEPWVRSAFPRMYDQLIQGGTD